MRKISIIGIGAGDPEYLTLQAIRALNTLDAVFVVEKRDDVAELEQLREQICRRFIRERSYRTVRFADPPRRRAVADGDDYLGAVQTWHRERQAIYERLFREELAEGQHGAFLAWGDPALYDSTLRIVEAIRAQGALALECEVIPGISSVQALAARHRLPLNPIGESVHITTGRKLAAQGFPKDAGSVVVLLDGECSFRHCAGEDLDIYWGAYLGTADEILVSGRLQDVMAQIEHLRAQARREKGWIMDTYLLCRTAQR